MAHTDIPEIFPLYITHVDGEGHFVRISGQLDHPSSILIETLFISARDALENGVGAVSSGAILENVICAVKYKGGTYYRAKIINTSNLSKGLVKAHFIDYGIRDLISLSAIRLLDYYDPKFLQIPAQATDYYLSRLVHPSGRWDEPLLLKLRKILCYKDYKATIEVNTQSFPLISINYNGNDLATHLVANRFGIELPILDQEVLLLQHKSYENLKTTSQPTGPVSHSEHVPFLMKRNFPLTPPSSMGSHHNVPLPFHCIQTQPSPISQRLPINKISSSIPYPSPANTPPPQHTPKKSSSPKYATTYKSRLLEPYSIHKPPAPFPVQVTTPPPQHTLMKPSSPKKSTSFKSRLLEVGSYHKVFVCFAEEGPELFAVQLITDAKMLQDMMDDINRRPHSSLAEPPMIGTVCLGRMSGDKVICRAIVMNLSGTNCDLFFVDFGDTEMVSYYDIFDIPEEFVEPNVYAMRFCLSGVKKLEKSPYLNDTFKRIVNGKVLTLKVVIPEGPPLIQYGELYLENKNVLDLLMTEMKDILQLKWMKMLPLGSRKSVHVSYVDSCLQFYIQRSNKIDKLNAVMDAVKVHCESSSPPGELPVSAACCARFPEDNNWYRAQVLNNNGSKVTVTYVDYGYEQEVEISEIRSVTPDLMKLPAQAIKCALKGYENKIIEFNNSKHLKMLALKKTLMAHVVGVLNDDTMLVSLVDETTNPPLDIAKRIMQLSTRRNQIEAEPATPIPTGLPEIFSSPKIEDGELRMFKPEMSLKKLRRPREINEVYEEGLSRSVGGENKESSDRADHLHSDRFTGRHAANQDRNGQRDKKFIQQNNGEDNKNENGNIGQTYEVDSREVRENIREKGKKINGRRGSLQDRAAGSFEPQFGESSRSQDSKGRPADTPTYKSYSKLKQVVAPVAQDKELPNPVSLEAPFKEPTIETGAQHEVSVTWIISPESFYIQILSFQPKFLEMMQKILEIYKGVKTYTGLVSVGASVLARYPADGVLYRATVVAVQPFSKFIVQYVDFGNKQLVDAKDIWQLDKQLMDLPKMAVHCSLLGVAPIDSEWKANPEIDLCFNAPRYQCVFQENIEAQWKVYLWNNSVNVADTLVEKQLAVMSEHQSSVAVTDEAVDLTIIVGQQMLCKVTHVESYEKFCVQLDLDKATLVENAIATYDSNKLMPLAVNSLSVGVHCIVKYEDKLYRAILGNTSNPEKIEAVLPDYGYSIKTSSANLLILPTELTVYNYQSLPCGLNNYIEDSEATMTVEEMKQRLLGNKFIIYINYVDEIRLMSTLYDISTGKKIHIFEPDEGAYDEVVPLCSRAVFNYNFGMAYISHAENLNEFYLQKSTDSDLLAQLIDDLFNFYEEGTPEELTTFEPDTLCAAKSSDGNWYRATIAAEEETGIKVQFGDYGNLETVPKDNVKKLDVKFFEPCSLALVAGLGLVALQDDALPKLLEWTTDKEVQVTLAFGTDGWLASLHLDGVDLSMKLVNENLATPKVTTNEEPKDEEVSTSEPISLPPGCIQVYISHIDTPGHFWLQMSDKIDKIEDIQAELQANADGYANIENRELGVICAAKYLADDLWYRAEILDADSDITTVRFIDYGNTDVLDNQPGLIKVLPDNLKNTERFAVKSSVNAVPTGTGEWSEPASEYFTQLVGDFTAPVDALIVLVDVTTYVDIYVNGQNLTDKLVSKGYAAKSEEPECGDMPSCFASHVNSPSEFWIQLESAALDLQTMESAMVDAEDFPGLTVKNEGAICAAKHPEDGAWYRAQIIVDCSEGTEVLFIDYGNTIITNKLRSLPEELKSKPALSRRCGLQKPRDIKSWSQISEVKFNELTAEGVTVFNVQFIASGDISIVDLYLDGRSITEELFGRCESHLVADRSTPVSQDLMTNGKICYVSSLQEFYVQLDNFAVEMDKIIERLTRATEFTAISDPKEGSIYAAFWEENKQWYRAKVLEFCDDAYHVLFIDYGSKAKCAEFRQLPEDLYGIDPSAKCCRLAGIEKNSYIFAEQAKKLLDHYASEATTFQIEFLDTFKEASLVRLFIEAKDFMDTVVVDRDKAFEPQTRIEASETLTALNFNIRVDNVNVTVIPTHNDKINNEISEISSVQLHGNSVETKFEQEIQLFNSDFRNEASMNKEELFKTKDQVEISKAGEDIHITKKSTQEKQLEISKKGEDSVITVENMQQNNFGISEKGEDILIAEKSTQEEHVEVSREGEDILITESTQEKQVEISKKAEDNFVTVESTQQENFGISKNREDILITAKRTQEEHVEVSREGEDILNTEESTQEEHVEISKEGEDILITEESTQEEHVEVSREWEDILINEESTQKEHVEISKEGDFLITKQCTQHEGFEISTKGENNVITKESTQQEHVEVSREGEDILNTEESTQEERVEISRGGEDILNTKESMQKEHVEVSREGEDILNTEESTQKISKKGEDSFITVENTQQENFRKSREREDILNTEESTQEEHVEVGREGEDILNTEGSTQEEHVEVSKEREDILITEESTQEKQVEIFKKAGYNFVSVESTQQENFGISKKGENILITAKRTQEGHVEVSGEGEDILNTVESTQEEHVEISKEGEDILITEESTQEEHVEISKEGEDILITEESTQEDQVEISKKKEYVYITEESTPEHVEVSKKGENILIIDESTLLEDFEVSKKGDDILSTEESTQVEKVKISKENVEEILTNDEITEQDQVDIDREEEELNSSYDSDDSNNTVIENNSYEHINDSPTEEENSKVADKI